MVSVQLASPTVSKYLILLPTVCNTAIWNSLTKFIAFRLTYPVANLDPKAQAAEKYLINYLRDHITLLFMGNG